MRVAPAVRLNPQQREVLEQRSRARSLQARVVERARIVLLAPKANRTKRSPIISESASRRLRAGGRASSNWASRALKRMRRGPAARPTINKQTVARIVRMTTQEKPPNATHWSTRTMAEAAGISEGSVRAHLAAARLEAALRRDVQGQQRSAVRRETRSHRRAVSQSARARAGAVLPTKRARSRHWIARSLAAAEEGPLRNDDARLQAQRNRHAVRGDEHLRRHRDQHVRRPASASGVAEVSARDRRHDAGGQGTASDRRQLRHAQTPQGAEVAGSAPSAFPLVTSRRPAVVAQHGRALLPRPHAESPAARRLPRCPRNWSRRSSDYIDKHNEIPSRSSGPPRLPTSWTRSSAPARLFIMFKACEADH